MALNRKTLLIVDDTEIDRMMLRSFLSAEFDVLEAESGNAAFSYITTMGKELDGILLDISMPHINGFDVLKFMADKDVSNIPVFLVTAEPTRDNVEKALQYHVAEFIGKPFKREDVLRRLRSRLGVIPDYDLRNEELKATQAYISDLQAFYRQYLSNFGKTDEGCQIRSDLMRIMLQTYNKTHREIRLNNNAIDLIGWAAYFCDIGDMLVPDKRLLALDYAVQATEIQQNHTLFGSNLIRLNNSPNCEYFVEVCSSICLHHHERFDGKGYPDGLLGENNSIFNQMCRILDEFEQTRSKFYGDMVRPVKTVLRNIHNDEGLVSPKVFSLLEDCEQAIIDYFMKKSS